MIRQSKRRDWFEVTGDHADVIAGLPGAKLVPQIEGFEIPRNMLGLIDDTSASRYMLGANTTRSDTWIARDARTQPLGFTLRTTQQQAIDFITRRRGTLLADDMRLGKGHPYGTGVLTPDGWRPIESLCIDDLVIGANGRPCRITGVYKRGALPIYRVAFNDGASVRVDGDHLWHVWDHNAWHRGGKHRVRATRDLIDDLVYANGNRKWRIPMVQPIDFAAKDLPIDPYVLGVILGDGSTTNGAITICTGDDLVPAEVGRLLPSDVELRKRKQADQRAIIWGISGVNRKDGRITNPITRALVGLGLMGLTSERKFVPASYAFGSVAQRLALLQGLMDTDGELYDGFVGFSSASQALAMAVRWLVESLGGSARDGFKAKPRYLYRGESRVGLPSYRLTIAMPRGISPFRTRLGYVERVKYQPARTIASINPVGEADVICISVDAPDQLYVTEHCIVTHNTLTAIMSHDPARGPLWIIAPLSTRGVWLGWLRRAFPGLPIGVIVGKKYDAKRLDAPIVFGHYEVIHEWQTLRPIGTLVLDEAHMLVNMNAKRSIAAAIFASRAEMVIAMTGTPIWTLPPDLWSVIGLVEPGAWGNFYDFAKRYGAPKSTAYGTEYTGISHEAELKIRLADVMLRRRWIDVRDDLPPITRSVLVAEVDEALSRKLDILAAALKSERSNTAANLAAYRRTVAKTKAPTVIAEAKKIAARGEPLVIWTWHKDLASEIASALSNSFLIHGDIEPNVREERMARWREQPNVPLVATMSVAQVGIDLSHARLAIFAEIDYTPAILAQAEMRTYTPDRPMDVMFVVANHMVDQRIVRALVHKLSASDPLGVGAAIDAIDALRDAVLGPRDDGDLDRLLEDLLAST